MNVFSISLRLNSLYNTKTPKMSRLSDERHQMCVLWVVRKEPHLLTGINQMNIKLRAIDYINYTNLKDWDAICRPRCDFRGG